MNNINTLELEAPSYLVKTGNTAINWNGGQRITLKQGDTATCQALSAGQLYGVFMYNSSGADHDIQVTLSWSNSNPPVPIVVPGTTGNQGLASVALVSGNDTSEISVSITSSGDMTTDSIDVWIGSVKMPTNTSGLNNSELPANGKSNPFDKYRRYYSVLASKWYNLTITSQVTQFMSIQFVGNSATVFIVNPTTSADNHVYGIGSVTENKQYVIQKAPASRPTSISFSTQGNGTQTVWMNADSLQNSNNATIVLQAL